MKDTLSNLLDKEEIRKNPFKAFAIVTAKKFEDIDENAIKCRGFTDANTTAVAHLKDTKVEKEDYNLFLQNYSAFKAKILAYVVGGTLIFNALVWMVVLLVKIFIIK